MISLHKVLIPFFVLVFIFGCSSDALSEQYLDTLAIKTSAGTVYYQIEIADDDYSRKKGLMYREHMPADHGMLFDFKTPRDVAIWMKNTYIPLDIIFIDDDGSIVRIATNTEPFSTELIQSEHKVRAVLEVNAAQVEKNKIQIGDKVIHRLFKK